MTPNACVTAYTDPMTRILVVDDEEAFCDLLVERLQDLGLDAHAANSGHEALMVSGDLRPTVILTDVMMDHGSGTELIMRLRERSSAKVIAMSGNPILLETAQNFGAVATLLKPFKVDQLLHLVEEVAPMSAPDAEANGN